MRLAYGVFVVFKFGSIHSAHAACGSGGLGCGNIRDDAFQIGRAHV